jgi:hypothetical protein
MHVRVVLGSLPGKILKVNDIGAALTGIGESRYSERVHCEYGRIANSDGGIEPWST